MPLLGEFERKDDELVFHGKTVEIGQENDKQTVNSVGIALVNDRFRGGRISATIEFTDLEKSACELILYKDPASNLHVTAGLGGSLVGMFTIRHYDGTKWTYHRDVGDRNNLRPGVPYHVAVTVIGSRVQLLVDDVNVTTVDIPLSLTDSQVGIWCTGKTDIYIRDFQVDSRRPKAFVVMQFTSPYNEIYADVIQTVCRDVGLDVVRADEEFGPGIIVADVARQIAEARVVIAEITPSNPNVYYELGYAQALNKPAILVAEKPTKLPFDVAPQRVLFYENTINGKARLEDGLRRHLDAVLKEPPGSL
jgi:hypothetical protein